MLINKHLVPRHVRLHMLAWQAIERLGRRVDEGHRDPDLRRRQRKKESLTSACGGAEEALDLALRLREQAATALLASTER